MNAFLKQNRLVSVLRAHEAQLEGYKMHRWNGASRFPCLITVFSAPNYCDVYNNKGAILKIENNRLNVQQFNYTPHPYVLPSFQNVFQWSAPFLMEKILDIVGCCLRPSLAMDLLPDSDYIEKMNTQVRSSKIHIFKKKVKAVTRMISLFRTLREEKEAIMQLKGLCPDNRVPRGLLLEGKQAIQNAIEAFESAKRWDSVNEMRPVCK